MIKEKIAFNHLKLIFYFITGTSFWYIVDCGSTHGTCCNKHPIEPGKLVKLIPGNNVIKFGGSSRLFTLQAATRFEEDEEDGEGKVTSTKSEKKKETEEDTGCGWGIDEEEATETDIDHPLAAIMAQIANKTFKGENSNEASYSANPQKIIQQWFDREGYDFEYKIDNLHNKFKCTVELPVDGQWIPVEGQLMNRVSFVFVFLVSILI